jgi:MFS family permease
MTWTVLQNAGTAAAVPAILPLVYVVPVPIAIVASGFLTDRRGPRFTLALSELGLGAALLLGAGLAVAGALSFGPTLLVGALVGTSVGLAQVPSQALIVRLVEQRDTAGSYG